tara:strand:- start:498 stop:1301 length:804 start_codon:yes stop_codon:yes gene_type:complete
MINNKTKLFFSISNNPGSSGSLLHNSFFKIIGRNAVYYPLKIKNLKVFYNFAKEVNLGGFSVSTPFKSKIIKYLDIKDLIVRETSSCNTVVNKNGKFIGYNTDYYAVHDILKKKIKNKNSRIIIIGNGSVTRTVLYALDNLKFKNYVICSRKRKKILRSQYLPFEKLNKCTANTLINTSSLGMNIKKKDKINLNKNLIRKLSLIIDFPISQNSTPFLQDISKQNKIQYISGKEISFYQGQYQIKIYNNIQNIKKYYTELSKKIKIKF